MRARLRKKLDRKRSDRRLREIILHICHKHQQGDCSEPLTLQKLNSLLYLVDVTAFRTLGYPLTGRRWRKTAKGVETAGYWKP